MNTPKALFYSTFPDIKAGKFLVMIDLDQTFI